MEYIVTKKKVRIILDKDPELKTDMNKIIIAYWNDELIVHKTNVEKLSFDKFSEMLLKGYLTSPEMIIRARTQLGLESPKYRPYSFRQIIGR